MTKLEKGIIELLQTHFEKLDYLQWCINVPLPSGWAGKDDKMQMAELIGKDIYNKLLSKEAR